MVVDIVTTGAALTVANKLLGKTAETIAADLANVYAAGRDKIIVAAQKKINNINDGKIANLRIARDVFWNGAYSDDYVCAEYFGGILASSRSSDGKDDRGIYYTDIIKSLSSQQLLFHYVIYHTLNSLWLKLGDEAKAINAGSATDVQKRDLCFSTNELESLGIDIDKDLVALYNKGLITNHYSADHQALEDKRTFPYTKVVPTMLGIQLYAVANNRLSNWRDLPHTDFGSFENVALPTIFGWDIDCLLDMTKLKKAA